MDLRVLYGNPINNGFPGELAVIMTLDMNQRGFSSLVILALVVFGVFIVWEANESINMFSMPAPQPSASPAAGQTFCPTGEAGNCNDSNDQFLFSE